MRIRQVDSASDLTNSLVGGIKDKAKPLARQRATCKNNKQETIGSQN